MGGDRGTTRNLKIVQVDAENNCRPCAARCPAPRDLHRGLQGRGGEEGSGAAGREASKVTIAKKPAAKAKK
jgi:hypothetical protein